MKGKGFFDMLVGFAGKARSGKSTAADCLANEYGFTSVALGDPIKRILKELFLFSEEDLWGAGDKTAPHKGYGLENGGRLTVRHCAQSLGTFWGRDACYQGIWVDYLLRTVKQIETGDWQYNRTRGLLERKVVHGFRNPTDVVIPDVRFKNEIEAIHKHGGFVILLRRPGAGLEGEAGKHRSETEIDGCPDNMFDAVVENVGTQIEFCKSVCNAFVLVKGRR